MSRAASIYFYHYTTSGKSRVYRITQLRTDGVHCRESAGTGPVALKVVRVTGAAFNSMFARIGTDYEITNQCFFATLWRQ